MMRFKKVLEQQRDELFDNTKKTLSGDIHLDPDDFPDEIDTASSEMNLAFQGRLRERERGLLGKITQALQKIDDGIYGECEACGEAIFKSVEDPDYRTILESIQDAKAELERITRFNMSNFKPTEAYIREMKRYGVLSESYRPGDPIDVYETDRRYWESLYHKPVNN